MKELCTLLLAEAHVSRIARSANLDISKMDKRQLAMGLEVEREHDKPGPTDVVHGSKKHRERVLLKIAMAHLKEKPDYYSRLKKVEK